MWKKKLNHTPDIFLAGLKRLQCCKAILLIILFNNVEVCLIHGKKKLVLQYCTNNHLFIFDFNLNFHCENKLSYLIARGKEGRKKKFTEKIPGFKGTRRQFSVNKTNRRAINNGKPLFSVRRPSLFTFYCSLYWSINQKNEVSFK